MSKSLKSKKVASPISTGNVGGDFESLVGAYYLAMVLLRSAPRGQEAGAAKEVKFQRLYEGEPLDDLIIISEYPVGIAKLAIQVKHDLVFGEKNEIFDEVIWASWKTFRSSRFVVGRDRFGFAIGLYSKTVDEHYQNVLSRARNSVNAEDFLKGLSTPGLFSKTQNDFVKMIRNKLKIYNGNDINDKDLWNFFRSMVILHFDFQRAGSRDQSYIIEMLCHLIQPEQKIKPSDIFSKLESYSRETKGVAGSLNFEILRQKLMSDGFSLLSPPDCRGDLKRLKIHSDFILKDIKSDIVGLTLNRIDAINNAQEKIKNSSLLELIGPPGVGKSAILKSLAEMQQADGPVMVLVSRQLCNVG